MYGLLIRVPVIAPTERAPNEFRAAKNYFWSHYRLGPVLNYGAEATVPKRSLQVWSPRLAGNRWVTGSRRCANANIEHA